VTSPLAIRSASDVGLLRKNNEDYLLVRAEGRPLLGVFDGMGGHPDGEVASRMAADTVADFIRRFEKTYQHPEPMLIDAMRAGTVGPTTWTRPGSGP
jgi:serine/threonine protein phosphatase PrpC